MEASPYCGIIDSHFHTQSMLEKGMDVFSVYDRLFESGFAGGIDIGCTHDDLSGRSRLLEKYPEILLAGAMGPWEAGRSETKPPEPESVYSETKSVSRIEEELTVLKRNLDIYKARFIGEIGLDYYWDYGTHEKQHLIFETQMKWAAESDMRVLIHDRDADADVIEVIKKYGPPEGGVIHCFDGCEKLMQTALDCGYWISFAGNLTYRSNTQLREMLKKVSLDRLLLETDSPYLSPVPLRGKPNCPEHIIHTYRCASEVLGIDFETLKTRILENYKALAGG